jgi:glycosyltransferase involved in cell wall biosynthesis
MIMGLSGDLFDLPSACLAARWCRLPFVAALDDDYVYQWSNAAERRFAVRRMRRIVGNARQVIVLNEVHADDLATRYGVRAAVVRNPRESLVVQTATKWPRVNGEIHVAFTGTVYQVNVDVIHAMVAALGLSGMESVVFDIYGLLVPSDLLGAQHPRVCQCGTRSLTESLEVQRNADVLLLPLGVANSIPDVIRTASPFKMGEYLFSGRPIIACAPAESFVAQYFRRNGCGLVVDGPNPHALAEAIRRIECDAGLRKELVHNALSCAIRDFELNTVREEFRNVLEIA